MEYGISYKPTVVPVDIIEAKEGLEKVTDFNEIEAFTLSALLRAYKCTEDMIKNVIEGSGIIKKYALPVQFFITKNPHTFASCITNSVKNIYLSETCSFYEQNEIVEVVESLKGSLVKSGMYHFLKRADTNLDEIKVEKVIYNPPLFDSGVRYLSLSQYKQTLGNVTQEKFLLVLYTPG